ncbi:MAG: ABC transporter permease [Planctomycetota bacterium]|nr:ABC transporter permease [Planctomycetota bacterium]
MIRLALAYLLRRPVQLLAVFGVAIGLLALLVVLSVMNGLIHEDRVSVRGPLGDLLLIPAVEESPRNYATYRQALESAPEIEVTAPHLIAYAILGLPDGDLRLSSTRRSDMNGVQVVGIDHEAETSVTQHAGGFGEMIHKGKLLPVNVENPFPTQDSPFSRPPVLLSDTLARTLPASHRQDGGLKDTLLQLGSLPYILPPSNEPLIPANGSFRLAGTYAGSDYEMSLDRIYMPRMGRNGLHYNLVGKAGPDFTEIILRLGPGVSFADGKLAVLRQLKKADIPLPGKNQGGALETWEERRSLFLSAIDNERRVVTLVMFFIVIVASFGLFTTLSALVREKIRDLGVLSALGFTPFHRAHLLMCMGAFSSGVGALLGYFGAYWLVQHHQELEHFLRTKFGIEIFNSELYVIEGLPARWDSEQALFLSLCAFCVGLVFTLAPAIFAARLSPVEALRYE